MQGGFKFKIPTKGYALKSLLDFQETLLYVEKYSYKEITEKEYNKLMQTGIQRDTTAKREPVIL